MKILIVVGISVTFFVLTALISRHTVYYSITNKVEISKESYDEFFDAVGHAPMLVTTGISYNFLYALGAGGIAMFASAFYFYNKKDS